MEFDPDQRKVIAAPTSARLLVRSGPGAGKTEVACARVAHLVDGGVHPSRVLFLSFTRAAVAEIRDRIQAHSKQAGMAKLTGARVTTLDRFAWLIQNHAGAGNLTGDFTDNIEAAIAALRSSSDEIEEYMQRWQLVIFDEAQDLIGERSMLAQEIITCLSNDAGVVVFADPAQRIYGEWATDESSSWADEEALDAVVESGCMNARGAKPFEPIELAGLYRTNVGPLVRIVRELRPAALNAEQSPEGSYRTIRARIAENVTETLPSKPQELARHLASANREGGTMVLFRNHGEAVELASYLAAHAVPYRLRLPVLPVVVRPWIGRLLYGCMRRRLSRTEFETRWAVAVDKTNFAKTEPAAAWAALELVAGDGDAIDLQLLREVLSRDNPPEELCARDVGSGSTDAEIVIGTIHGSKGREADRVLVSVMGEPAAVDKLEARVLYVAATRARKSLSVSQSNARSRIGYLGSHRAWTFGHKPGAQRVEFGLKGDFDPLSPVAKSLVGSDSAIRAQQERFASSSPMSFEPVQWSTSRDHSWARLVTAGDGRVLGRCSDRFTNDLFKVVQKLEGSWRPPDSQAHLHILDFTTIARPLDHPDLNGLSTEAAAGGFWVAPVIQGFSMVWAKRGRPR